MCVMSMVIDRYVPFPDEYWQRPQIDELRKALEEARHLDKVLGKEDCVDPEKAKLLDRIAELEKKLPPVPKNLKAEIDIIAAICDSLEELPADARKRVYAFVMSKYPA